MSKYIISISFLLFISINQNTAQIEVIEENKVIIGPKKFADPSAKLEVNSVESPTDFMNIPRGMLLPRMSFAQMNAIADTRDALMVFVNDDDIEIRGYYYYDGKPKEWVRIPSNNCRACTDQFFEDSNGNGIPDKIILYDCDINCDAVGNDNIISISTDFSDLCELDLEYNTYEIFVDDVSVTGILPLDDAGEICYESETINESEVRIVLYSDCCCETIEYLSLPECIECPDCNIDLSVTCINDDVDVSASTTCTIQDLLIAGYTTVNVYTHPNSMDFADAILVTSAAITTDYNYSFVNTDNNFSLWVSYSGSPDCEEIIAFQEVVCTDESCFCIVTNVVGNNVICEGETGLLTAQLNCVDGWTGLLWDWGAGSQVTVSPDDNLVFGAGLPAGTYQITVTPNNSNDCGNFNHVETVVIDDCQGDCVDDLLVTSVTCNNDNSINFTWSGTASSINYELWVAATEEPATLSCDEGGASLVTLIASGNTTTNTVNNINTTLCALTGLSVIIENADDPSCNFSDCFDLECSCCENCTYRIEAVDAQSGSASEFSTCSVGNLCDYQTGSCGFFFGYEIIYEVVEKIYMDCGEGEVLVSEGLPSLAPSSRVNLVIPNEGGDDFTRLDLIDHGEPITVFPPPNTISGNSLANYLNSLDLGYSFILNATAQVQIINPNNEGGFDVFGSYTVGGVTKSYTIVNSFIINSVRSNIFNSSCGDIQSYYNLINPISNADFGFTTNDNFHLSYNSIIINNCRPIDGVENPNSILSDTCNTECP
mgnify:CR=1 FL=1